MTYDRALIVGGGIAGPVTAMALQKVGIEATVYEAYDRTAHGVGSFMNVATNGLDGLRTLGAQERVKAAAFPTSRMVMWSGTGKQLGEVENGTALADGTVSMTMNRADLYAALYDEATSRDIPIEHGKQLVDAEHTGDGVVARFADGSETRGSMLIGADGLWSTARTLMTPEAPEPRYLGLVGTGGCATGVDMEPSSDTFHMMFGKRAFFGYAARDGGTVWWFANVPRPAEPTAAGLAAVPADERRLRLLHLFTDDASPATRIIRATDHDLEFWPMHDLAPAATWHRGRMVLAGDAAHATSPSSGQGASLAIEDSLELARCLRDRTDTEAAFTAYRRLRHERVQKVFTYAARINQNKAAGPVVRIARDAMMPFFLKRFAKPGSSAWLGGHHIDFDQPIDAGQAAA